MHFLRKHFSLTCIVLFIIILPVKRTRSFPTVSTTTTNHATPSHYVGNNVHTNNVIRTWGETRRIQRCKTKLSARATTSSSSKKQQQQNQVRTTNASGKPSTSYAQRKNLESKIISLGRKGKTDEALSVYHSINQPTIRLMNSAIDACARARPTRLEEAFTIFENSNLQPNVFTFGTLISACSRARDADRALSVLRSMKKTYGIDPNAVVYSTAISAVARSDPPRPQLALDLIREATVDKKLAMNVVGYNAVIAACAKAGDWKRAIFVLDQIENFVDNKKANSEASTTKNVVKSNTKYNAPVQPDTVTYGTILSACEKGEQWELVLKYANTAVKERNIRLDALAITSCLHACQQLGLAQEAMQYLNLMKEMEASTPIRTRYLNDTFSEASDKGRKSPYNNRKTFGWQRSGAKKPLQGPDEVAYRLAISACARGREWKEGIRLLNEYRTVTGKAPDVVAYTAAVTGCEYAGEWKEAFRLLENMRRNGIEPNEFTMAAVIGACGTACAKNIGSSDDDDQITVLASSGMPQAQRAALKLLNVMKKDDTVVNPNIIVYNSAIRTCAEACDLKRAVALLNEIREEPKDGEKKGIKLQPTVVTYGTMMTACERVGNVDVASKVFKLMKEDGIKPNEIIYGAAISCCRKANEPERALLLLRKMIREGLSPNVATFNTVIMSQAENGRKASTRGCLDRSMLVYKIMTSKMKYDSEVSSSSSSSPSVSESKQSSIHPLTVMLPRPNRQTYNLLIRQFASNERPIEAEILLDRMRNDGYSPDVDLYTATVAGYERTGQPLKALQVMESMREDGYDFYDVPVLDNAFKKAIKLVNVVGRSLTDKSDDEGQDNSKVFDFSSKNP